MSASDQQPVIIQNVSGTGHIFVGSGEIHVHNPPTRIANAEEQKRLLSLAQAVRVTWIRKVLENSLYQTALIDLHKESRSDMVEDALREAADVASYPWTQILEAPGQPSQLLAPNTKIHDIFEEARRFLLILGEPGSGKTTTLLELARDLIRRHESDSTFVCVPVVLSLSNWRPTGKSFRIWIEAELNEKYRESPKFTRNQLERKHLYLLLDGLDEVPRIYRSACVNAINEFCETGVAGIAVCSRTSEYTALGDRLRFGGAVCIQPLTHQQIDDYFQRAGVSFATLRRIVERDSVIKGMASSPLMLSVMSLAYKDAPLDRSTEIHGDSPENCREHIFDTYVQRMISSKKNRNRADAGEKIILYLSWLARELRSRSAVFLIEDLQPDWLPSDGHRLIYTLASRFLIAVISAVCWALIVPITIPGFVSEALIPMLVSYLVTGIAAGLIDSRHCWLKPKSKGRQRIVERVVIAFCLLIVFVCSFAFGAKAFSFSSIGFSFETGIWFSIVLGLKGPNDPCGADIRLKQRFFLSFRVALRGVKEGFVAGAILGALQSLMTFVILLISPDARNMLGVTGTPPLEDVLIGFFGGALAWGVFFGVLWAVIKAASSPSDIRSTSGIRPGSGIRASIHFALLAGIVCLLFTGIVWGLLALLISGAPIFHGSGSQYDLMWWTALILGVPFGIAAAMWSGAFDVIKHLTLRLQLQMIGCIPTNYVNFLDQATRMILLQNVGPGYIFIHRILLEHFANRPIRQRSFERSPKAS